ncbi:MAG: hypothetical protein JWO82_2509 [Akkermansiaceae bacterium]|nr:hypothetical protein [Akkermansiaceae bacterium]
MRDLSPDFATACQAGDIYPALLVYLDFLDDPLRCWTGLGPLEWAGHTYLGFGNLGEVPPVEEYSDIRAGVLNLGLTGVPNHALSGVSDLVFKKRTAEIHLAMFAGGDSPELIGVELLLRGTMDTLKLKRGPSTSSFELALANELARLRDSWGLLYTDPHQRQLYPDDTSLRFVQSFQDLTIKF